MLFYKNIPTIAESEEIEALNFVAAQISSYKIATVKFSETARKKLRKKAMEKTSEIIQNYQEFYKNFH